MICILHSLCPVPIKNMPLSLHQVSMLCLSERIAGLCCGHGAHALVMPKKIPKQHDCCRNHIADSTWFLLLLSYSLQELLLDMHSIKPGKIST